MGQSVEEKQAINFQLKRKLNPRHFSGMSPKMAAILGFLLDEKYTVPSITEMAITSDGYVLAGREGDIGLNDMIGSDEDLNRNIDNLIEAAGLNPIEREEIRRKVRTKIVDWRAASEFS